MSEEKEMTARSGFGLRWSIVTNSEKGMSARLFAAAELVLLPLSFVTFTYVLVSAGLSLFGVDVSAWEKALAYLSENKEMIVGSWFKHDHNAYEDVCEDFVGAFMDRVREYRR